MTMIARSLTHGIPFIYSDLLISSGKPATGMILPGTTDEVRDGEFKITIDRAGETSTLQPTSLRSKCIIIEANLCLAAAGAVKEINSLVGKLKSKWIKENIWEWTESDFREVCISLNLETTCPKSEVLIGFLEKKNDKLAYSEHLYGKHWREKFGTYYGDLIAVGSGSKSFLDYISSEDLAEDLGDVITQHKLLRKGILLATMQLLDQRYNRKQTSELWGGSIEVTSISGNGFAKVENLAVVILHLHVDESNSIFQIEPRTIIHQYTQNKFVRVTSIESIGGIKDEIEERLTLVGTRGFTTHSIIDGFGSHGDIKNESNEIQHIDTSNFACGYAFIKNGKLLTVSLNLSVANPLNHLVWEGKEVILHLDKKKLQKIAEERGLVLNFPLK